MYLITERNCNNALKSAFIIIPNVIEMHHWLLAALCQMTPTIRRQSCGAASIQLKAQGSGLKARDYNRILARKIQPPHLLTVIGFLRFPVYLLLIFPYNI